MASLVTTATAEETKVREEVPLTAGNAPRFNISNEQEAQDMLKYLDEHGYAVVASVATAEQCQKAIDDFWTYHEGQVPKLRRSDPSTWDEWLPSAQNGILNGWGFNHSDFTWNTRLLPGVKKAFARIWGTQDLITSFDGGNAFRPWKHNPSWLTDGGWWHVDQNAKKGPHRQGKVAVQGLVTYYDATIDTGGLCVIPGSHNDHDIVCDRIPGASTSKVDYIHIPIADPVLQTTDGVMIMAKAGDLLLWDSRTIHCNSPALTVPEYMAGKATKVAATTKALENESKNYTGNGSNDAIASGENGENGISNAASSSPSSPVELIRLVSYVCMLPYSHASTDCIHRRKLAFINHQATTHWPNLENIQWCESTNPRVVTTCPKAMLDLVGYRSGPRCTIM